MFYGIRTMAKPLYTLSFLDQNTTEEKHSRRQLLSLPKQGLTEMQS